MHYPGHLTTGRKPVRRSRPNGRLAGGPGFEPGLLGPEPRVLPLNYPPAGRAERAVIEVRKAPGASQAAAMPAPGPPGRGAGAAARMA